MEGSTGIAHIRPPEAQPDNRVVLAVLGNAHRLADGLMAVADMTDDPDGTVDLALRLREVRMR